MRLRLFLSILFTFACIALSAQQTTSSTTTTSPQNASDPQAVAVVQAAITAIGGATAITPLQSWTFQGQASGRVANGPITEVLAASLPPTSQPAGTTVKTPPPWAQPRSLLLPALMSAILISESQNHGFLLKQGGASGTVPNSTVVIFALSTKAGSAVAQRWHFDNASNLPTKIEFMVPAKFGVMETFPGTVTLSNYKNVGGVLYPFQIVTFLQREHVTQTITLQSVTPSTTLPASNTPTGGAQ